MLSREATNTILIVFGLSRSGLEPEIYRTWSNHDNHYTTDAVVSIVIIHFNNIYKYFFTGRTIQRNEHCSVEDSRATLDLYKLVRTDWEQKILEKEIKRQTNNNSDMIDSCEVNLNCNHGNDNKNEVSSTSYLSDEFWPQYLFS